MVTLTRRDVLARREEIVRIARAHGASDIRLFGSVARDEADETSDIDFLVTPAEVTPPSPPAISSLPSKPSSTMLCRLHSARRE